MNEHGRSAQDGSKASAMSGSCAHGSCAPATSEPHDHGSCVSTMSEPRSHGACAPASGTHPLADGMAALGSALEECGGVPHPERYLLGKPHPDRAKQFKPFAALRGYDELVAQEVTRINARTDFSELEEGC